MHRVSGTNCDVDAIVMLTWSKVWITKAITIFITKAITISITKAIANVNRTIHPRPNWRYKQTKVAIPREASQNQTPFSFTGAVVDFSSAVPVKQVRRAETTTPVQQQGQKGARRTPYTARQMQASQANTDQRTPAWSSSKSWFRVVKVWVLLRCPKQTFILICKLQGSRFRFAVNCRGSGAKTGLGA